MIENRHRLERQIFLGRQSVRRAMQSGSRERMANKIESMPQEPIPPPNTGTNLPTFLAPPVMATTATEEPLPMDTDAEAAYINGSSHRGSLVQASTSSHRDRDHPEHGSSRHPRRRRTPISVHADGSLDDLAEGDFGAATPDPPPPPSGSETDRQSTHSRGHHARASDTSSLFKRLRKASLNTAFSPFASLRRPMRSPQAEGQVVATPEPVWSGDSSSDDDDLSVMSFRRSRFPSALELHQAVPDRNSSDEGLQPEVDRDS